MGRKKLKKGENVIEVRAYVKEKHKKRMLAVLELEANKIKIEELTEKTKEVA